MRYDDSSYDPRHWTTRKLIDQLNIKANIGTFSGSLKLPEGWKPGYMQNDGPVIRETVRLYLESWMQPILDEVARRIGAPIIHPIPLHIVEKNRKCAFGGGRDDCPCNGNCPTMKALARKQIGDEVL